VTASKLGVTLGVDTPVSTIGSVVGGGSGCTD